MTEQELLQENERLRRELADVANSRDRLREIVCAILSIPPSEVMEREIDEMMKQPRRGIDDILGELQSDSPFRQGQPISV